MTAPTPPADTSDRPRFRAGQTVTFRAVVDDLEVAGHALVLRLLGDLAHLAILGGGGHVQVPVDALAPVPVADVPNPLPVPDAPAEGSGS